MKTFSRILSALDIVTGNRISTYFRAGVGLQGTDAADDGKYRRLTNSASRDLAPMQYSKVVESAYYLYLRNPMASRMIEIMRDFCIGNELKVTVKIMKEYRNGEAVDTERGEGQQIWDRFACDPYNRFDTEFDQFVLDLLLSGELLMPVTVNEVNGFVRYGYCDSKLITGLKLEKSGRDVDTVEVAIDDSIAKKTYKCIRYDVEGNSETEGKLVGDAFYFRINHVGSQNRGHSELIQSLDWIDGLDQFLFNSLEGSALRNAFFYDMLVQGASEDDLRKLDTTPPKSGTVKAHNEKVTWEAVSPDLKANDTSETARLFKNFILAGKGYPEHWFSDGGNTNLATAENMNIPTMRMLKKKQDVIMNIIKQMADFVLQCAVDAQQDNIKLAEDEYFDVQVNSFDFERKDAAVVGAAFVQVVQALVAAKSQNWLSDDNAKQVVDGMLDRLGVAVSSEETVEDIAGKNITGETKDIYEE